MIEIDGPVHDERHWDADVRRLTRLESQGFRALRFSADLVDERLDEVVETIYSEVTAGIVGGQRGRTPHPRKAEVP